MKKTKKEKRKHSTKAKSKGKAKHKQTEWEKLSIPVSPPDDLSYALEVDGVRYALTDVFMHVLSSNGLSK